MRIFSRLISLFLLVYCIVYFYLAYTYELLPFEVYLPFRPNTMPLGLAVLGIIFSFILLISSNKDEAFKEEISTDFKWLQAILIILYMVIYAFILKTIGFIPATIIFITISSITLGERNYKLLLFIALVSTVLIWYLVSEILGIYLQPFFNS